MSYMVTQLFAPMKRSMDQQERCGKTTTAKSNVKKRKGMRRRKWKRESHSVNLRRLDTDICGSCVFVSFWTTFPSCFQMRRQETRMKIPSTSDSKFDRFLRKLLSQLDFILPSLAKKPGAPCKDWCFETVILVAVHYIVHFQLSCC